MNTTIQAIYRTLRIEVQDKRLEAQGRSVDLFFDTVDVRRALLGMWDYVDNPAARRFQIHESFEQPAALVGALVGAEWLGPFRMLPPHQSEILRQLDRSEAFTLKARPNLAAQDRFFEGLGLLRGAAGTDAAAEPRSLMELSVEGRREYLLKHSPKAPRLFKAVQCVRYPWWERLQRWREADVPLLDLRPLDLDVAQLTERPEFDSVARTFAALRGDVTDRTAAGADMALRFNDFADAVAVMALVALVERYEEDPEAPAVRFFDSAGTFREVARSCQLLGRLHIQTDDGLSTPVLCDSRYFIHKASFRQEAGRVTGPDPAFLYGKLEEIFDDSRPGGMEILEEARVDNRSLRDILDELEDLAFLRNVWLETSADQELADIVARLDAELSGAQPAVDKAAATVIRLTKDELESNTKIYQQLSHAWIQVEQALGRLRDEHKDPRPVDPVRDFKLIRFGLKRETTDAVKALLETLLDRTRTTEEIREGKRWHDLMRRYLAAREQQPDGLEHAEYVAAALWCLRQYVQLVDLLNPYAHKTQSTPAALLYAGGCITGDFIQLRRAKSVIRPLMARKNKASAQFAKAHTHESLTAYVDLCIGLAYLHFHEFELDSEGWSWRNAGQGPDDLEPRLAATIRKAISLASEACDAFTRARLQGLEISEEHRDLQQKEVYAQNQRLYYLLEFGDPDRDDEISHAYERLGPLKKSRQDLWLWTFSDTLARYFHYEAVWSEGEADWTRFMEIAQKHIADSVAGVPHDAEPELFHNQLARWKRKGFAYRVKVRPAKRTAPAEEAP